MPAAHPASLAAPANTGGSAATSASESSEKRQYSATGLNTILVTGSEADRDGTSITSELRASRDPMNGMSRGYLKPHPVVPKSAPEGDGLVVQGQVSLT